MSSHLQWHDRHDRGVAVPQVLKFIMVLSVICGQWRMVVE